MNQATVNGLVAVVAILLAFYCYMRMRDAQHGEKKADEALLSERRHADFLIKWRRRWSKAFDEHVKPCQALARHIKENFPEVAREAIAGKKHPAETALAIIIGQHGYLHELEHINRQLADSQKESYEWGQQCNLDVLQYQLLANMVAEFINKPQGKRRPMGQKASAKLLSDMQAFLERHGFSFSDTEKGLKKITRGEGHTISEAFVNLVDQHRGCGNPNAQSQDNAGVPRVTPVFRKVGTIGGFSGVSKEHLANMKPATNKKQ